MLQLHQEKKKKKVSTMYQTSRLKKRLAFALTQCRRSLLSTCKLIRQEDEILHSVDRPFFINEIKSSW